MVCSLHFYLVTPNNNNNNNMNTNLFVVLLVIAGVVWGEVQSCTSCGSECQSACGTRHFRTCCFNYLKKRNLETPTLPSLALDPSLRLELWLARTRNPYLQQQHGFDTASMEMSKEFIDNKEHETTS